MSYSQQNRRPGDANPPVRKPDIPKSVTQAIISGSDDDSVKQLVQKADDIGAWLKEKNFSTSQIRNIFGNVREIEQRAKTLQHTQSSDTTLLPPQSHRELLLLKPKLAYQYGKETKTDAKEAMLLLKDVLSDAIDTVGRDRQRFSHFVDFFEAILAYHRFHGGK
jgi:CRISPR-associated protein Csm2